MISMSDSVRAARNRMEQVEHELRELETDLQEVGAHVVTLRKQPDARRGMTRNPNLPPTDPVEELAKIQHRMRQILAGFDRVSELAAARRAEVELLVE
jgi:broad specificity phosphatase PhoE